MHYYKIRVLRCVHNIYSHVNAQGFIINTGKSQKKCVRCGMLFIQKASKIAAVQSSTVSKISILKAQSHSNSIINVML